MRFATLIVVAPCLALAVPAVAQDVIFAPGTGDPAEVYADAPQNDVEDLAERFDDPVMHDGIASAVEGISESIMRLPVGRFADAVERARPGTVDRRLPHDATVGDLAGRDADYLPQELGDRTRDMMGMAGGFARALAVMMPEFERMGREMEESVRAAKREARRRD